MSPSTASLTRVLLLTGSVCLLSVFFVASLFIGVGQFREQFYQEAREYEVISNGVWKDIVESITPTSRPKRSPYDYAGSIYERKKTCDCAKGPNNCPPGPPGRRGKPGHRGHSGRSGKPGQPGVSAEIFHRTDHLDFYYEKPCKRVQCPPGEAGHPGPPGPEGDLGKDGLNGVPGLPGRDGLDGREGATGEIGKRGQPGIRGPAGYDGHKGFRYVSQPGSPGRQGVRGPPGKPGRKGFPGADGKEGVMGARGPAGRWGENGEHGKPGEMGERGPPGDDAEYCKCPARTHELDDITKVEAPTTPASGYPDEATSATVPETVEPTISEQPEPEGETTFSPENENTSDSGPPNGYEHPEKTQDEESTTPESTEPPAGEEPSSGSHGNFAPTGYEHPESTQEESTPSASTESPAEEETTTKSSTTGYDKPESTQDEGPSPPEHTEEEGSSAGPAPTGYEKPETNEEEPSPQEENTNPPAMESVPPVTTDFENPQPPSYDIAPHSSSGLPEQTTEATSQSTTTQRAVNTEYEPPNLQRSYGKTGPESSSTPAPTSLATQEPSSNGYEVPDNGDHAQHSVAAPNASPRERVSPHGTYDGPAKIPTTDSGQNRYDAPTRPAPIRTGAAPGLRPTAAANYRPQPAQSHIHPSNEYAKIAHGNARISQKPILVAAEYSYGARPADPLPLVQPTYDEPERIYPHRENLVFKAPDPAPLPLVNKVKRHLHGN